MAVVGSGQGVRRLRYARYEAAPATTTRMTAATAIGSAGEVLLISAAPTPGDGVAVGDGVVAGDVAMVGGTARWVAGGGDTATGLGAEAVLVGVGVGARVGRGVGRAVGGGVGGGVAGLVMVMRPCIAPYPWMVQ
jgi:hypothetical protein